MSSPIIWIIFPALTGGILLLFRHWYRTTVFIGTCVALVLAGLPLIMPIQEQIRLGPVGFRIADNLDVLGRQFILHDHDRVLITITFSLVAFWFAGAYLAHAGRTMVPFGLLFIAIMIAAFSVQPFLYGSILIEIAVILSIPVLVQASREKKEGSVLPEGSSAEKVTILTSSGFMRGALRFLVLQTVGMPFLLIIGWVLAGVETAPGPEIVVLTASLAGFGFMLLLAIFPFHTWVLMLVEKSHPYVVTFILVVFFWFVSLSIMRFMDQYLWLSQSSVLQYLRYSGLFMISVASASVVFERNLARMLGYAVLIETGYVLLAASLANGFGLIFQMLLPRTLSFASWAFALGVVHKITPNADLDSIRGLLRFMPVTGYSIIVAQMSVAGIPMLAAFPVRYVLWQKLASESIWLSGLSMVGLVSLFLAGIRTSVAFLDRESQWTTPIFESRQVSFLLGVAILVMFLVGSFPQLFLPLLTPGLQAFENLASIP